MIAEKIALKNKPNTLNLNNRAYALRHIRNQQSSILRRFKGSKLKIFHLRRELLVLLLWGPNKLFFLDSVHHHPGTQKPLQLWSTGPGYCRNWQQTLVHAHGTVFTDMQNT